MAPKCRVQKCLPQALAPGAWVLSAHGTARPCDREDAAESAPPMRGCGRARPASSPGGSRPGTLWPPSPPSAATGEARPAVTRSRAPGRAAYAGSEPPDLARPCTTPAPARSLSLWGQEAKGGAPAQVAQGGLDWKRVLPGCCPQAAVTRHPGAGKLGGEPRTGEASVSMGAPTPSRQQGRSPARPSEPAGAQEDAVSDPQRAGHCGQVAARVGLHLTRGRLVNWMGARWGREQRDST